jgi:hypothetical protein
MKMSEEEEVMNFKTFPVREERMKHLSMLLKVAAGMNHSCCRCFYFFAKQNILV